MVSHEFKFDSEGYQLVPDSFTEKGFDYKLFKTLKENWQIYSQSKNGMVISYELVLLKRQESYTIAGNTVPKKWTYPSGEHWGIRGFTYKTPEEAEKKFQIINSRIAQR